jgi:hypothetical protein
MMFFERTTAFRGIGTHPSHVWKSACTKALQPSQGGYLEIKKRLKIVVDHFAGTGYI